MVAAAELPASEIAAAHEQLARCGAVRLPGAWVHPRLPDIDPGRLAAGWNHLPVDPYLPGGANYRRRRFSRFCFEPDTGSLALLPQRPFFQSRRFNTLCGGFARHFAPLDARMAADRGLAQLVALLVACLPWGGSGAAGNAIDVNLHQIRVVAGEAPVEAAPEGIHQDGHEFLASVLFDRQGVVGGRNVVTDASGAEILGVLLEDPLDLVLIDDRRTRHGVLPLAAAGGVQGHRDVLLVDFNRPGRPPAAE